MQFNAVLTVYGYIDLIFYSQQFYFTRVTRDSIIDTHNLVTIGCPVCLVDFKEEGKPGYLDKTRSQLTCSTQCAPDLVSQW